MKNLRVFECHVYLFSHTFYWNIYISWLIWETIAYVVQRDVCLFNSRNTAAAVGEAWTRKGQNIFIL